MGTFRLNYITPVFDLFVPLNFYKRLSAIEDYSLPFSGWLLGLGGVIAVRILLENFSSNRLSREAMGLANGQTDFFTTVIHYPLFYVAALLGLILIVSRLSKEPIGQISRICTIGFIVIWLAPLLDLFFQFLFGWSYRQAYLVADLGGLLLSYLTFFGPLLKEGITPGIRVEVAVILIGVWWFMKGKGHTTTRAFFATLLVYTYVFFLVSLPSLVVVWVEFFDPSHFSRDVQVLFSSLVMSAPILSSQTGFSINQSVLSDYQDFTLAWTRFFSWVYVIGVFFLGLVWYYRLDSRKARAFFENVRLERVVYYCVLAVVGGTLFSPFRLWQEAGFLISIIVLFISLASSWVLQVHINDIYDVAIDRISNPQRPLVRGTLSLEDYRRQSLVLAILVGLSAASLGWDIFFLVLSWNAILYIYSAPPYRLRRFFPLSNICIGAAGTLTIIMGYVVAAGKSYLEFPGTLILASLVALSIITMVKDRKDASGDARVGASTIFTIFGVPQGSLILGGLLLVVALALGVWQRSWLLTGLGMIATLAVTVVLRQEPYHEHRLFYIFFIGVGIALVLLK